MLACVVAFAMAIELLALAWPEPKTEADGRIGRGLSGEIAGSTTLGQRFTVTAPGLRSITFYPRPYAGAAEGTVALQLVELRRDDKHLIDRRLVPVADVLASDRYTFRFKTLGDSRRKTYLFTIAMRDTPPGHGIMVELMKHDYPGNPPNRLYFAGVDRYGSLRFNTEVDRPTMLIRTVRYLRQGAFGTGTIVIGFALWTALHVLGFHATLAVRHADV